jgi:hypothetical protein
VGGCHEQPLRLAGRSPASGVGGSEHVEGDLVQGIADEPACPLAQRERGVRSPGIERGLRGQGQPVTPAPGVDAELGRLLERSGRRSLRTSRERQHTRRFELARQPLVGPLCDNRPVPGGRDLVGYHRRERLVGGPALLAGGRPVHRRTHQRVTKGHRITQPDQPVQLGGGQVGLSQAQPLGGVPDRRQLGALVRGSDDECAPRAWGQRGDAGPERVLDSRAHRRRAEDRLRPLQLGNAERGRQLQQGKRIPPRAGQQAVDHLRSSVPFQPRREQRRRIRLGQPAQLEVGHSGHLERQLPRSDGDQHRDALGLEPTYSEAEGLRRRRIKPLGIVDTAQHGRVLTCLGEQTEQTETHQEPVGHPVVTQAQGTAQSRRLRAGQAVDKIQAGADELVHSGERKLVLGLDACTPQYPHVTRPLRRVREQRRLADPRLSAHDERRAALAAGAVKKRIKRIDLRSPPPRAWPSLSWDTGGT